MLETGTTNGANKKCVHFGLHISQEDNDVEKQVEKIWTREHRLRYVPGASFWNHKGDV